MTNSQWESQSRFAAAPARAVFERQHSAVAFGDLTAEREADACACRVMRMNKRGMALWASNRSPESWLDREYANVLAADIAEHAPRLIAMLY